MFEAIIIVRVSTNMRQDQMQSPGILETRAWSRVFLRISNNNLAALVAALLLAVSSQRGNYLHLPFPLYQVYQIGRATTSDPTVLEQGRFGECTSFHYSLNISLLLLVSFCLPISLVSEERVPLYCILKKTLIR